MHKNYRNYTHPNIIAARAACINNGHVSFECRHQDASTIVSPHNQYSTRRNLDEFVPEKCIVSPVRLVISEISSISNESRSPTAMAEVLPQIRVRAATQSRDAGSKMEPPANQPLKDATNGTANGRIILPESAEGETPSQLPGFSNIDQPRTTNLYAESLTLLSQHDSCLPPKAIQASSCSPFQAVKRMLPTGLQCRRNGEIRKQLTLYHTYVSVYLVVVIRLP